MQKQKTQQGKTYTNLLQPTTTWINKLAITQHLRQTTKTWNIHTTQQHITTYREQQWQQKWQKLKKLHDLGEQRTHQQNL